VLGEAFPREALAAAAAGDLDGCRRVAPAVVPETLPRAVVPLAVAVWRTLLGAAEGDTERARLFNNLSTALAEEGDRAGALEATRRAVAIREALAEREPAAYQPVLAGSLFNLALLLDEGGERDEALTLATRARDLLAPHFLPGTGYADGLAAIEQALAAWGGGRGA
jgi:tetratricopeptide (TPR) repeat protein